MPTVTLSDAAFAAFLGYGVSVFLAWIFVPAFHHWTKTVSDNEMKREPIPELRAGPSSTITGTFERAILATIFVWRPEAAATLMGAWIVMKTAAHWGRESPIHDRMAWIRHGFLSLQTTILSMLFAIGGGLAARWALHMPFPEIAPWSTQ